MKPKSRIRKLLIVLSALAACGVLLGFLLHSRARQREVNLTLVAALQNNDIKLARKAMDQGADVNIRENPPEPPKASGLLSRLKILLWPKRQEYGTGKTVLTLAAGSEDLEFVNLLIKRGADVNDKEESVLEAAAGAAFWIGSITPYNEWMSDEQRRAKARSLPVYEVLTTLLDHGLKIDSQSPDYFNALSSNSMLGDPRSERLLIRFGEKQKITDHDAYYPLARAIYAGRPEIINALIDRGASLGYQDFHENRYMVIAGQKGSPEIIKLLLDRGADVNMIDKGCSYNTALIAAIASKRPVSVVKLLVSRGAKVNGVDIKGLSVMDWACIVGNRETIELLRKAGAKTVWQSEAWYKLHPSLKGQMGLD
jgi:ankyrin repeat protein